MIYYNLMEMLRKNEYFLTRDLVNEIREVPDTPHYRSLVQDSLYERIHQVIYHTYKRHSSWLGNDTSRSTISTFYSEIGRQRCREGIPLQEVIEAVYLIKRRIYRYVLDRMALEEDYVVKDVTELFQNVSLFFDRVTRAIVAGYQEELAARNQAAVGIA